MVKQDVRDMAKRYSKDSPKQAAYIAGFQACCNIINKKMNVCDNAEFVSEMEELSEVTYFEFE